MANEKRLIDSAELISMLPVVEEDKQISLIGAVADVVCMISQCHPVDAVKVGRCGSCRHASDKTDSGWLWCDEWNAGSNCGGYCHKYERRCE